MAKVNMAAVKVAVAKDSGRAGQKAAKERADQVFEDAVLGMQIEFEDHPVTREIDGGIYSKNLSGTLGGGNAPKNLFAFIGFPQDSDPLEPIRNALNPDDKTAGPKLLYRGKETVKGNARFKFEVQAPDKQKIYKRTPMPWASGWSWAQKIETKIPGFSRFLARYMPFADDEVSRSKGGTQLRQDLRGDEYQAPEQGYLTTIFRNFLAQVRQYNKGGFKRRFK